jgi:hypothetical protein
MKINLEKSLIRENRKLATPKELLLVKEYETNTDLVDNDALSRVGFNEAIKTGKRIKEAINDKKSQTENFKQERVFHISQIKAICEKYYLKFLSAEYYKGIIDKELPTKITNFEAAYGVKCSSTNTKICAPLESFQLQDQPKDPLMFYQINDEYYYLIHKWGNDLSIVRMLYALFTNGWFCWLFPPVILTPIMLFHFEAGITIASAVFVLLSIFQFAWFLTDGTSLKFLSRVEFDSPYHERSWWD